MVVDLDFIHKLVKSSYNEKNIRKKKKNIRKQHFDIQIFKTFCRPL